MLLLKTDYTNIPKEFYITEEGIIPEPDYFQEHHNAFDLVVNELSDRDDYLSIAQSPHEALYK